MEITSIYTGTLGDLQFEDGGNDETLMAGYVCLFAVMKTEGITKVHLVKPDSLDINSETRVEITNYEDGSLTLELLEN